MKRRSAKNNLVKKKKLKTSHVKQENEKTEIVKAEILDVQRIREDMVLLGCVTEVRSNCFMMSLPGCMMGRVPIMNISRKFTESLIHSERDEDLEVKLAAVVKVGSTLPCKVLKVKTHQANQNLKKPTILISVDPQVVNSELRMMSLYLKMVLYSSVQSAEDHGYVMDVGVKGIRGFLPFSACGGNKDLTVGQIIPTSIRKLPSQKEGSVVWLSKLDFNDQFAEIDCENLTLNSITPGANVSAYITEVKHPFLYMRCNKFVACANMMSVGRSNKNLSEGDKVSGTVLYVHPLTNMVYLHLGPKPSPDSFQDFFPLQKYDLMKNLKYQFFWCNKLVFQLKKGVMGYVWKADLPGSLFQEPLAPNSVIPKARVVFLHYMDNLVQLSLNDSMIDMEMVRPQDITVGFVCEAKVSQHVDKGMFVTISPGLNGFVRHTHFSDVLVTMPEKLYPVNSTVKCRVLALQPNLSLTCKESLISLPESDILADYSEAILGRFYKGVVVQKTYTHLLVVFFNNIKGLLPLSEIPASSVIFIGQTISCQIIACLPKKRRLKLSLKRDVSSFKKQQTSKQKKVIKSQQTPLRKPLALEQCNPQKPSKSVIKGVGHQMNINPESEVRGCVHITEIRHSETENDISSSKLKEVNKSLRTPLGKPLTMEQYNPQKTCKAVIKGFTGHQMNIILDSGVKGRVHITEIGHSETEFFSPLKEFKVGQQIQIHVFNIYEKRSKNFLVISHRNMNQFLECSLKFPPPAPLEREFFAGMSVTGFVKEVSNTSAMLWLSPLQTATLDYLHMDQNPKVLRKLRKKLKVGVSLNVKVLEVKNVPNDAEKFHKITLTKLEDNPVKKGNNVVGLVQIACIEKGLVFKLPYGYHGVVSLTDIQDVFIPVHAILEKYLKLGFILCHVLEVNASTKFCNLSLRKSRLYGHNNNQSCPELTVSGIVPGKSIYGYVKLASDDHLIVNFGRMLDGKVMLHRCQNYSCNLCKHTQSVQKKYAPGDVIKIKVEGNSASKGLYPLSLPEFSKFGTSQQSRLSVTEDIDWNDL